MHIVISRNHIPFSGRFLDKDNNPVAIAVREQLGHLHDVTACNGRLVYAHDHAGRDVRYKLNPGFTPSQYNALLQEKSDVFTFEICPIGCLKISDDEPE